MNKKYSNILTSSSFKNQHIGYKAFYLIAMPAFTGLLLGISALPSKLWYLSFVAFIPLLIAAEKSAQTKKLFGNFILQLSVALIVFYTMGYSWVLKTAYWGFIIGYLLLIPFLLLLSPYILFKTRKSKLASVYFIAAWLTIEYIQSYYTLGTPFYNLGHNPGANVKLIQWYSVTGASGGSLWILTTNFLLYQLLKSIQKNELKWKANAFTAATVLVVPVLVSLLMFYTYEEKGTPAETMVVHPSTDNRDVKYRVNIYELMDIYLDIILPQITENTEYVVLPETAITNAGWISDYNRNLVFQHWYEKTAAYPNVKLVSGAITYEAIPNVKEIKGYEKIPGIRYSENYKTWYYTYNAALFLDKKQPVQIRAKDELVPYQEYAPFPRVLPYIVPVGIDFQFSKRPHNRQLFLADNLKKTAAFICYEIVYSRLFFKAARNGATAFFMMLNEGWYNTPKVPRQFLQLSAIRAIENRRYMAHSSNLGISAIINQKGEIVARENSKTASFLKHDMYLNRKTTVAATLGNYIEVAALVTIVVLVIQLSIRKTIKK